MFLDELFAEVTLPDDVMNEKLLLIPKYPAKKSKIIHAGYRTCSSLTDCVNTETRDYLIELHNDYEQSRSLFETVSFNEFMLMKDKYCKKCVESTLVNVPPAKNEFGEFTFLSLYPLKGTLRFFMRRLKGEIPVSLFTDLQVVSSNMDELNTLFKTFPSLAALRSDVLKVCFNDRVNSWVSFREETATFVSNFFARKHSVAKNSVTENRLVPFQNSLKNELVNNTDMVIFDATALKKYCETTFGTEETHDLLEKIAFSPGFHVTTFTVLPYVEFEALNMIITLSNDLVSHESRKVNLSNNVTVPNTSDLTEICATMESLFDKNNEVMSNYTTLYDVASTI